MQQRVTARLPRGGAVAKIVGRQEERQRLAPLLRPVLEIVPQRIHARRRHIRVLAQIEGGIEDGLQTGVLRVQPPAQHHARLYTNSKEQTLPSFPLAQIEIEEVPVIVVFLDTAFGVQPREERQSFYAALQAGAARAGFSGELAAIWQDDRKYTHFIAPPQQHAFFQVANYAQLRAQITDIPLAVEPDKKR